MKCPDLESNLTEARIDCVARVGDQDLSGQLHFDPSQSPTLHVRYPPSTRLSPRIMNQSIPTRVYGSLGDSRYFAGLGSRITSSNFSTAAGMSGLEITLDKCLVSTEPINLHEGDILCDRMTLVFRDGAGWTRPLPVDPSALNLPVYDTVQISPPPSTVIIPPHKDSAAIGLGWDMSSSINLASYVRLTFHYKATLAYASSVPLISMLHSRTEFLSLLTIMSGHSIALQSTRINLSGSSRSAILRERAWPTPSSKKTHTFAMPVPFSPDDIRAAHERRGALWHRAEGALSLLAAEVRSNEWEPATDLLNTMRIAEGLHKALHNKRAPDQDLIAAISLAGSLWRERYPGLEQRLTSCVKQLYSPSTKMRLRELADRFPQNIAETVVGCSVPDFIKDVIAQRHSCFHHDHAFSLEKSVVGAARLRRLLVAIILAELGFDIDHHLIERMNHSPRLYIPTFVQGSL